VGEFTFLFQGKTSALNRHNSLRQTSLIPKFPVVILRALVKKGEGQKSEDEGMESARLRHGYRGDGCLIATAVVKS